MSVAELRADLAEALEGEGWNVYAYPPAVVSPPAIIVVPDEPYLSLVGIGRDSTRIRARFRVTAAVAQLDNQAQLDALERLVVSIYQNVPQGSTVGDASRPATTSVGPSDLLTSDLTVELVTIIEPTED